MQPSEEVALLLCPFCGGVAYSGDRMTQIDDFCFYINEDIAVIRWDDGSCRPASKMELCLWEMACKAKAPRTISAEEFVAMIARYNSVLLKQPLDSRNQPLAMQAALATLGITVED